MFYIKQRNDGTPDVDGYVSDFNFYSFESESEREAFMASHSDATVSSFIEFLREC